MSVRDIIRDAKATTNFAVRGSGQNLTDLVTDVRNSGVIAAQASNLLNSSTPTQGHERLAVDDFVGQGQVFDGTNTSYSLSRRVLGRNLSVTWCVQATGTMTELAQTTNPAPSAGQFWFDDTFTVRVGSAPAALDGLTAKYIVGL